MHSPAMNLPEFKAAAATYQKRLNLCVIGPFAGAFLVMAIYVPFEPMIQVWFAARFSTPYAELLAILPIGIPIAFALFTTIPLLRRATRETGIPCPHCGKELAGHEPIIVASRHCPHCGRRVVHERS